MTTLYLQELSLELEFEIQLFSVFICLSMKDIMYRHDKRTQIQSLLFVRNECKDPEAISIDSEFKSIQCQGYSRTK
jgi:hypothetical protein